MSNDFIYNDNHGLSIIANKVESHLLLCYEAKCTKQFTKSSTVWKRDDNFDWLLRLKCRKCEMEWAVCCKCSTCKKAMINKRQISTHNSSYHRANIIHSKTKRKIIGLNDKPDNIKCKKKKDNFDVDQPQIQPNEGNDVDLVIFDNEDILLEKIHNDGIICIGTYYPVVFYQYLYV